MRSFALTKEMGGHSGKISVVDMVRLGFIGFLYLSLVWYFLRPEKFSEVCSFGGGGGGGGGVGFYLPCKVRL